MATRGTELHNIIAWLDLCGREGATFIGRAFKGGFAAGIGHSDGQWRDGTKSRAQQQEKPTTKKEDFARDFS